MLISNVVIPALHGIPWYVPWYVTYTMSRDMSRDIKVILKNGAKSRIFIGQKSKTKNGFPDFFFGYFLSDRQTNYEASGQITVDLLTLFWTSRESLDINRIFGQKSKFWTNIKILGKNRNFGQISKFLAKIQSLFKKSKKSKFIEQNQGKNASLSIFR